MNTLFLLLLLSRPDVADAVKAIHADTFDKHIPIECVVLVKADSVEYHAGTREQASFPTEGVIAVIHTHPDAGFEKPSPQDLRTAKELGIPVIVISKARTYAADSLGNTVPLDK